MENGVGLFVAELQTWGCHSSANWRNDDKEGLERRAAAAATAFVDGLFVFDEVIVDAFERGKNDEIAPLDSMADPMVVNGLDEETAAMASCSPFPFVDGDDEFSEYTSSVIFTEF